MAEEEDPGQNPWVAQDVEGGDAESGLGSSELWGIDSDSSHGSEDGYALSAAISVPAAAAPPVVADQEFALPHPAEGPVGDPGSKQQRRVKRARAAGGGAGGVSSGSPAGPRPQEERTALTGLQAWHYLADEASTLPERPAIFDAVAAAASGDLTAWIFKEVGKRKKRGATNHRQRIILQRRSLPVGARYMRPAPAESGDAGGSGHAR